MYISIQVKTDKWEQTINWEYQNKKTVSIYLKISKVRGWSNITMASAFAFYVTDPGSIPDIPFCP